MANDELMDTLYASIGAVEQRLAANPPTEERNTLEATKEKLLVQFSEVSRVEVHAAAQTIIDSTRRLKEVIASAGRLPFSEYISELAKAVIPFGVRPPASAVNTPTPTGGATNNPAAPSASSLAPARGQNQDVWTALVNFYRTSSATPDQLKIASLAQWIMESGRGTSELAKQHLNFGGIKFRARMQEHATPVDYTGTDGDTTAYCKFTSVGAFVAGYWHFISSGSTYAGWQEYRDNAAGYLRHIAPSYAGDPDYLAKVLGVFAEAKSLLTGDGTAGAQPSTPLVSAVQNAKLAIVVGHNPTQPGASAKSPIFRSEFAFNSAVAQSIKQQAQHYNLDVEIFFRSPAGNVSSEIRAAYAKVQEWGASCAMELHFNSADGSATGCEVLLRPNSAAAQAFASATVRELQTILGLPLRHQNGLKVLGEHDRGWISVSALPEVPTVLAEPFFGSNEQDCLRVGTVGESGLAIAYLRAARSFLSPTVG